MNDSWTYPVVHHFKHTLDTHIKSHPSLAMHEKLKGDNWGGSWQSSEVWDTLCSVILMVDFSKTSSGKFPEEECLHVLFLYEAFQLVHSIQNHQTWSQKSTCALLLVKTKTYNMINTIDAPTFYGHQQLLMVQYHHCFWEELFCLVWTMQPVKLNQLICFSKEFLTLTETVICKWWVFMKTLIHLPEYSLEFPFLLTVGIVDKADGHCQKNQYNLKLIVSLHCLSQCTPRGVQAQCEGQIDMIQVGSWFKPLQAVVDCQLWSWSEKFSSSKEWMPMMVHCTSLH